MAEADIAPPSGSHQFKKALTLWDATMIASGSMIGSGIFIVSADMARQTGSSAWLMVLWLLSGVITVMAALCYGELAGMMPKAGGQFVYIQRSWGNTMAFLYGWTVFMVIQTGVIAAVAVAFAKYSGVFFPFISPENIIIHAGVLNISTAQLVAIVSIALLTAINSMGVKEGKWIQTLLTSVKLLALLIVITAGIYVGWSKPWLHINFHNAWSATHSVKDALGQWSSFPVSGIALLMVLGTAIIGSLFSSDAWNNVTFIAGEIINPQKNVAKSLLLGTGIVTLLYCLSNLAYLSLLPLHGDPLSTTVTGQGIQFAANDRVGTAAASQIFGNGALYIMAVLIMISTFGCNNGIILSGARVYYAMANEGLFFKKAAVLNKNDVPGYALIIQAVWASVLCLSGTYGDLLDYATFASLLFYVITIAGLIRLRYKEPETVRPYKVALYPFMPIIYIVLALSICIILLITKPQNTWSGVLIVLLGLPVYYFNAWRRKHTMT